MLTPERIAELEKIADEVMREHDADTEYQEELRIYEEQGPHGLALYHIGRDVATREAKEAEIAQATKRSGVQKSHAADEVLAHSIVAPFVNSSSAFISPAVEKQPTDSGNRLRQWRAKPRRKPIKP